MARRKLSGFDGAVPRWPVEMRTFSSFFRSSGITSFLYEILLIFRDRFEFLQRFERPGRIGDAHLLHECIDENERRAMKRHERRRLRRRVQCDLALERRKRAVSDRERRKAPRFREREKLHLLAQIAG